MSTKIKSKIIQSVHDTASDLHHLGFIDKRKMALYDALCLKEIPHYSEIQIRSLRKRYHLSQAVLATLLNISLSTVRQWEIGHKHPSGPSDKLLHLLDKKGLETLF